jgi:PEP-CTERM motif
MNASLPRLFAVLLLLVGLILCPGIVRAQVAQPLSDFVELTLTDQNGLDVVPPMRFIVPEPTGVPDPGEVATFTLPAFTIDFLELSATGAQISDRFRINPCEVTVVSIDGPPRTNIPNLKRIPGAALEIFHPLQIVAFSDGEHPPGTVNLVSDYVRITQGFWNAALGPGQEVFFQEILEPTSEDVPEPRINFTAPPAFFDVAEPPIEDPTGQLISDYVDLPISVAGAFISSDNQDSYVNLPPIGIRGFLVEDPLLGGTLHYDLRFVSHVIPEPASIMLLGIAIVGLGFTTARRRSSRA